MRTEKNARVKAQAQASADAQQATEALRQRQERVQSELADADAAIRREKDEQGHLRRKAKGIALALEVSPGGPPLSAETKEKDTRKR